MLKLVKWAIHRQFFLSCPLWQRSKTSNKSCLSFKRIEIQGVSKLHKWGRPRQYCFNHVYSGREVKAKKINL
jgi:hypothetical protein